MQQTGNYRAAIHIHPGEHGRNLKRMLPAILPPRGGLPRKSRAADLIGPTQEFRIDFSLRFFKLVDNIVDTQHRLMGSTWPVWREAILPRGPAPP